MPIAHFLLNLETLQFARRGARQLFLPDVIAHQTFRRSDLVRKRLDFAANRLFGIDDPALAQQFKIGHDYGVEPLRCRISGSRLQRHHANLFHVLRLQIVRLDLFGIDILSVGEHDDFLAPSSDKEIAAGIEITEIARVEPAVAQHFGRRLGPLPISLHHDRAANGNFAYGLGAIFGGFRIDDFAFNAGEWRPDRPKYDVAGRIKKRAAGGFCEAIRIENVDAKTIKIARNGRIEARSSSNQIAHVAAKSGVNLSEEEFASVDSDAPQRAVESHQ